MANEHATCKLAPSSLQASTFNLQPLHAVSSSIELVTMRPEAPQHGLHHHLQSCMENRSGGHTLSAVDCYFMSQVSCMGHVL
jgi:hypothetical protein